MKRVDAQGLEWEVISNHRETSIQFKRLIQGEPDTPENFELSLVRMSGDYTTPAHHHNFEQVRLALKGAMGYGPGRAQPEGSVGYFPEGSFYAQDAPAGQVTLLLQCGGASGSGFLSYDQVRNGAKTLSAMGGFEDGMYKGRPGDNRPPKDGYEAVWEHVRGRDVEYPAPRYEDHMIMMPDAFHWRRTDREGVSRKHLATVTERQLALEYLRFDPGGPRDLGPVACRTLLFVLEGEGAVEGQRVRAETALELMPGEEIRLQADDTIVCFVMTLPKLPLLADEETIKDDGTMKAGGHAPA